MSAPRCDYCGKSPAVHIVRGMPSPEMIEQAERGEIVLGGCVVERGQPEWTCRECAAAEDDDS